MSVRLAATADEAYHVLVHLRLSMGDAGLAQIIVHEACHEANAGPWYKAAERCGAKVRVWRVDPDTCETRLEDLRELIGPATKLVALVHVSNILGEARFACRLTSFCPRSSC